MEAHTVEPASPSPQPPEERERTDEELDAELERVKAQVEEERAQQGAGAQPAEIDNERQAEAANVPLPARKKEALPPLAFLEANRSSYPERSVFAFKLAGRFVMYNKCANILGEIHGFAPTVYGEDVAVDISVNVGDACFPKVIEQGYKVVILTLLGGAWKSEDYVPPAPAVEEKKKTGLNSPPVEGPPTRCRTCNQTYKPLHCFCDPTKPPETPDGSTDCPECADAHKEKLEREKRAIHTRNERMERWSIVCPKDYLQSSHIEEKFPPPAKRIRPKVNAYQYGQKGILLGGPPELGKSRLMYALCERLAVEEGRSIKIFKGLEFKTECLAAAQGDLMGNYHRWRNNLLQFDAIFIDDLGKFNFTLTICEVLHDLMESIPKAGKPIFITTNLNPNDLARSITESFRASLMVRLRDYCPQIHFDIDDTNEQEPHDL